MNDDIDRSGWHRENGYLVPPVGRSSTVWATDARTGDISYEDVS